MKKYWMLGLFGGALSLMTPSYTDGTVTTKIKNVEIGGEIRSRYEYRRPETLLNVPGRGSKESDDRHFLRTRLHAKLDFGDGITGKVTLSDAHVTGTTAVGTDDAGVTVHEGYINVENLMGHPIDLQVGRSVLHYGSGRLIAHLDWANAGRHWDGAKLRYNTEKGWLDLVYAELVNGDVNSIGSATDIDGAGTAASADDDSDLYFLWLHQDLSNELKMEAYAMLQRDGISDNKSLEQPAFSTNAVPPKDINRRTYGTQLSYDDGTLYANGEYMWQDGNVGRDDIDSYAYAIVAGFNVNDRLTLEYEHIHASGDSDSTDGNDERFKPAFTFGHKYHGWADLVGFTNSVNNNVKVKYKIDDKTKVTLAHHWHQRENRDDAWYGANTTTVIRSGLAGSNATNPLNTAQKSASGSNDIGQEFNFQMNHKYSKNLDFMLGYAHFFEGAFARETGTSGDQDFYYLQTRVRF